MLGIAARTAIRTSGIAGSEGIVGNLLVAHQSGRYAQFQVVDGLHAGEEALPVNVPRHAQRGEVAPAVIFGETARVVGAEGGRHVIAVQQGVVHAGNQRVQTGFRDARLRGIGAGAVAQVILFQRFVGEMVGAQVAVGGFRSLSRKACQCVQIVDAAEVACVGGCVFLLPDVGLPVARAADALRGQSQRGVCSREIVLRQLLAAESHGGF